MMNELPPLRKIRAVEAKPGYRVLVAWENGRQSTVDLSDMISRGGVFSALADKVKFSAVRVGEGGRVIEWPDPRDDLGYPVIEIDSIALASKSEAQEDAMMLSFAKKRFAPVKKKGPKSVLPGPKS